MGKNSEPGAHRDTASDVYKRPRTDPTEGYRLSDKKEMPKAPIQTDSETGCWAPAFLNSILYQSGWKHKTGR